MYALSAKVLAQYLWMMTYFCIASMSEHGNVTGKNAMCGERLEHDLKANTRYQVRLP